MAAMTLAFDTMVFACTLWLGLYLIARDRQQPRLWLAGLGLVAFAGGWALDILRGSVAAGRPAARRSALAVLLPYVAGLKPYSRRAPANGHDPTTRQALAWFRDTVPERTLYNWQTAAAILVAKDIRARLDSDVVSRYVELG